MSAKVTHNKEADEKVRAARTRAVASRPYFATGLYAVNLVQSRGLPTMAIDRHRIVYYNPDFVMSLPVEVLASVVLHEVHHALKSHHERAGSLGVTEVTAKIANVAMDIEINDDHAEEVERLGDLKPLPDGAVYPSLFEFEDGKMWETYYHRLIENSERFVITFGDGGNGPEDGGNGGDAVGLRGQRHHVHIDDCGSGAHSVKRAWELDDPSAVNKGLTDSQWHDVQTQVARNIVDHVKKRGFIAGDWVEWANSIIMPPPIPWNHLLGGHFRSAVAHVHGKVFYSYTRPSRRSSMSRFIMPSLRKPKLRIAVVGDTSGSMDNDDLMMVAGVVEDLANTVGAVITFLATDSKVQNIQRVNGGRGIKMAGRGGTNMAVGIEHAATEVMPRPNIIVCVSDCETPWPDKPLPHTKLIICGICSTPPADIPPWASFVLIPKGCGKTLKGS